MTKLFDQAWASHDISWLISSVGPVAHQQLEFSYDPVVHFPKSGYPAYTHPQTIVVLKGTPEIGLGFRVEGLGKRV